MKQLYRYKGPVYNYNVIYKSVDEYVHAHTPSQALTLIGKRLRKKYGLLLWLKESNLHLIKKEVTHQHIDPEDQEIQLCWSCSWEGCNTNITHRIIEEVHDGFDVLLYCEQHYMYWKTQHPQIKIKEATHDSTRNN